tara:strand:+ start:573 stop:1406 length:834 start_codon:yes stop_codon:yes gene_type:complete
MSTLSVLMCVYEKDDDEAFSVALDSLIINKDFINDLIIVINGPISEKKRFKINYIIKIINTKKIELKRNFGISKALNFGLKEVNTDWIVRFDSDDICLKDRFKIIKEKINQNKDIYDVMGTYIEEFNIKDKTKIIRKVPLDYENIKNNFLFSNPMNHVSVFFKSSLLDEFNQNNFYPLIDGFEDYALWIKLLSCKKKFRNFPIVTVLVRANEDMIKRRGGIKYIINEIRFRLFIIKYISIKQIPINIVFALLRIIIFASPKYLRKLFYKFKRLYFEN